MHICLFVSLIKMVQIEGFCSAVYMQSDVMRPGVYKHSMTSDMREMMNNHLTDQQDGDASSFLCSSCHCFDARNRPMARGLLFLWQLRA